MEMKFGQRCQLRNTYANLYSSQVSFTSVNYCVMYPVIINSVPPASESSCVIDIYLMEKQTGYLMSHEPRMPAA